MSNYTCLIWDWNGTLFDDLDICIRVMNRVLASRRLPLLDSKRYKEVFGFPVKQYYSRLGFDFTKEPFEKISMEYIAEYQKESLSAKLNGHSLSTLDYLHSRGIRQVVLSASQKKNLEEQIQHFGIIHFFDRLLGLDDCHAASKIDVGRKWLAESGLNKSEVLLVGDTLHDYETACELGCDCILVGSGHQSWERVSGLGVPVIESLVELKRYLAGDNRG